MSSLRSFCKDFLADTFFQVILDRLVVLRYSQHFFQCGSFEDLCLRTCGLWSVRPSLSATSKIKFDFVPGTYIDGRQIPVVKNWSLVVLRLNGICSVKDCFCSRWNRMFLEMVIEKVLWTIIVFDHSFEERTFCWKNLLLFNRNARVEIRNHGDTKVYGVFVAEVFIAGGNSVAVVPEKLCVNIRRRSANTFGGREKNPGKPRNGFGILRVENPGCSGWEMTEIAGILKSFVCFVEVSGNSGSPWRNASAQDWGNASVCIRRKNGRRWGGKFLFLNVPESVGKVVRFFFQFELVVAVISGWHTGTSCRWRGCRVENPVVAMRSSSLFWISVRTAVWSSMFPCWMSRFVLSLDERRRGEENDKNEQRNKSVAAFFSRRYWWQLTKANRLEVLPFFDTPVTDRMKCGLSCSVPRPRPLCPCIVPCVPLPSLYRPRPRPLSLLPEFLSCPTFNNLSSTLLKCLPIISKGLVRRNVTDSVKMCERDDDKGERMNGIEEMNRRR